MLIAIYRWRLHPEREQDFVTHWRLITLQGLAGGSGGSSLFRDARGVWVAIARWPSRDVRDRFFLQLGESDVETQMSERSRREVIERFPNEEIESVLDVWAPFPNCADSVSR